MHHYCFNILAVVIIYWFIIIIITRNIGNMLRLSLLMIDQHKELKGKYNSLISICSSS